MIHWQNFYHDATCDQLDELIHWADLAASPYALIACIAEQYLSTSITHENLQTGL